MKDRMNDKKPLHAMVPVSQKVYALQHLETSEFICLRQGGREHLACFTDGDTATQFRAELGLIEYVDIVRMRLSEAPFQHFWLDGETISRAVLLDQPAKQAR
ncbi:MAG: hypothetical protein SFU56_06325 [Capsulimonadales bacterium]|nr:hypothetical protein [Capsulimonadales bacterium]